jgi:hypothetical protein
MSHMKSPVPTAIGYGAAISVSEEQQQNIATIIAPQVKTVTLDMAMRAAAYANSYSRLRTIIDMFGEMESYDEWLAVLGDNWTCCDNVSLYLSLLRMALPRCGPVRPMMCASEQAAWDALPDKVTIYRGQRRRQLGASWSLDEVIAERFPFLSRYRYGGAPVLITAEVRKRDILAIKLDREEAEAIVLRGRRILSREPIEVLADGDDV